MIIRFTPEVDAELADACQWYAHQRKDLDIEFMESIDDAMSRVARDPDFILSFTEISDERSFGVFLSLCFMKLQRMRFR